MTAVEWKRAPMGRLAIVVALLVVPLVAGAQHAKKVPTVGIADSGSSACKLDLRGEALYGGLRDLGYIIGTNVTVDRKCYASREEMRKILAGFVAAKVDLIHVTAPAPALLARELTRDIPIVCASCGDPVGNGLVRSLQRPGGNVTGFASLSAELIGKRLGLLKESAPKISRVVALVNPDNPGTELTLKALDESSKSLGLKIVRVEFRASGDFERTLAAAAATGADAMLIQDDPFASTRRRQIADFALKARLPASGGSFEFADEGVMMSYGANRVDLVRRTAGYVDRILKGTKPGDLPFEQASKLDLVINLKTAKQLGLKISEALLLQATRIIE